MEFKLKMNTDNAAFEDAGQFREIMLSIADDLEEGKTAGNAFDVNGNMVGRWEVK